MPMPRQKYAWEKLTDEQLLKQRFSSLKLAVEGTWLEDCLGSLYEELHARATIPPASAPVQAWRSAAGAARFDAGSAGEGGSGALESQAMAPRS